MVAYLSLLNFHIAPVSLKTSELAKVLNGTPGGFAATATFIISIRFGENIADRTTENTFK